MFPVLSKYMPVKEDDSSEDSRSFEDELYVSRTKNSTATRTILARIYMAVLHILVLLAAIRIFHDQGEKKFLSTRLLPGELPAARDAIRYEEITFDPSGFWKDPTQSTPYEGNLTVESEAAWGKLTSVGMLSLSKEEMEELNLESIEVPGHIPGQEGRSLVTIEMFHQLHCLHYIRKRLYGEDGGDKTEHAKTAHLGHCVDYLRQVIMCHGDLTLITLGWNDKIDWLEPNFSIRHTCRNFDSIWAFAESRNDTWIIIEGS